ncbi:MAG: GNAT family N-acetyltransferase [Clostridia bacterium]|nr:GNAT family N-acetyltransferase [Clostridia bacterium]
MEKLMIPDETMLDEIRAYRQAFLDSGDSMDGTGCLRECEDPQQWLRACRLHAKWETTPQGRVPATQFVFVREDDQRIVGMLDVRHAFNDYLEKYGGHIGYSVHPDERGKGYASQMLRDALVYCKALELDRVLITCLADNEASRRTIVKNGGAYEYTVREPGEDADIERYWIAL